MNSLTQSGRVLLDPRLAPTEPGTDFDQVPFLVVEDSVHDAALLRRAFGRAGAGDSVVEVTDGEAAMEYLQNAIHLWHRRSSPLPGAILADLQMQRMDGFELTTWIRAQPELQKILVIVLTGSNLKEDAERAFACGANFFLTKPSNLLDLEKTVRSLVEWLRANPDSVGLNNRLKPRALPFVRRWYP